MKFKDIFDKKKYVDLGVAIGAWIGDNITEQRLTSLCEQTKNTGNNYIKIAVFQNSLPEEYRIMIGNSNVITNYKKYIMSGLLDYANSRRLFEEFFEDVKVEFDIEVYKRQSGLGSYSDPNHVKVIIYWEL